MHREKISASELKVKILISSVNRAFTTAAQHAYSLYIYKSTYKRKKKIVSSLPSSFPYYVTTFFLLVFVYILNISGFVNM